MIAARRISRRFSRCSCSVATEGAILASVVPAAAARVAAAVAARRPRPRPRPEPSSVSVSSPSSSRSSSSLGRRVVGASLSPSGGASAGAGCSSWTTGSEIVSRVTRCTPKPTATASAEAEQTEEDGAHQLVPARSAAASTGRRPPRARHPRLATRIDAEPPQRRASVSTIARPSPVPGRSVRPRRKRSKTCRSSPAGTPGPSSRTASRPVVVPGRPSRVVPARRVDERVLDQVVEHDRHVLLPGPHERVAVARRASST